MVTKFINFLFIALSFVFLTSCSLDEEKILLVEIPTHKFEYYAPYPMWYKLIYFDGLTQKEEYIPPGVKKVEIKVLSTGLRPIVALPLNHLNPFGGFYEPVGKTEIVLNEEEGSFSKLLLDASFYAPNVVSAFSFSRMKESEMNYQKIESESFLENLFKGTLNKESVKDRKLFNMTFSSLPLGLYLSDNPKLQDILIRNLGEEVSVSLFSGIYNLWSYEKDILYTFIITEEGEVQTTLSKILREFEGFPNK